MNEPPRRLGPPTDLAALLPPTQRVVRDDGAEVAYRVLGEGTAPPLVLVHGMGSAGPFWARAATSLASDHRVVVVDLPGHGESSKRPDHVYSMAFYADAVESVVRELDVRGPTLVGHSMGAQVAVTISLRRSVGERALVLVNPAGFEGFDEAQAKLVRAAANADAYRALTPAQLSAAIQLTFSEWNEDGLGLVALRRALLESPDAAEHARAVEASVHAMLDGPIRERLGDVAVPALVVMGEDDRLIPNRMLHPELDPRAVAEWGARALGGAPVVMVPGAGHMVPAERPDELVAELRRFLSTAPTV